jgi:hypothetical protein
MTLQRCIHNPYREYRNSKIEITVDITEFELYFDDKKNNDKKA